MGATGNGTILRRWVPYAGQLALAIAVLTALAVSLVYIATEPQLRRTYDVPLREVAVPGDTASIADGRRLATIRGCYDGCHGKGVSGGELWNEPWVYRIVAPDLTRVVASQSDSELERVIRHGVRQDGRTTWGMPSIMFYHLSDEDLGKIIAFLRSLPTGNGPDAEVHLGPLGRFAILVNPAYAYAEEIAEGAPWATEAELRGPHGRGRYLALTVCSECHGMDLKGEADGGVANLVAAASYSRIEFARLMRTGVALGNRRLGLMTEVAESRFSHLNDDEVNDLYDYLVARAGVKPRDQPPGSGTPSCRRRAGAC